MNNDRKMELSRAILSAAYIAAGIILISHPGVTGIIICRAAGILALLFGGFRAFTAQPTVSRPGRRGQPSRSSSASP